MCSSGRSGARPRRSLRRGRHPAQARVTHSVGRGPVGSVRDRLHLSSGPGGKPWAPSRREAGGHAPGSTSEPTRSDEGQCGNARQKPGTRPTSRPHRASPPGTCASGAARERGRGGACSAAGKAVRGVASAAQRRRPPRPGRHVHPARGTRPPGRVTLSRARPSPGSLSSDRPVDRGAQEPSWVERRVGERAPAAHPDWLSRGAARRPSGRAPGRPWRAGGWRWFANGAHGIR
jgi:hypothetical protein